MTASLLRAGLHLFAAESGGQRRPGDSVPRPRIQTLSDLIFGLALSIGALTLISTKPSSVVGLAESLLGFGFSFLMLALIWVRYTRVMSVVPVETGRMTSMNMLLLFLVSVEPYLFNLITGSAFGSGQIDSGTATSAYALDMGSIFLLLSYFTHELTVEDKKLVPKELLRKFRLMRNATIATAALFYVSTIPLFWTVAVYGVQLRVILWMCTFATFAARRGLEGRRHEPASVNSAEPVYETGGAI